MPTLSIVTACYNEEDNVDEVYRRVRDAVASLDGYTYEHIFIDNHSTDRTLSILKGLSSVDSNVKVIANARNFGHIRSPMHALFQASGDAVIGIVADLQDPPEMIPELVRRWELGDKMVLCVKRSSEESQTMHLLRRMYYAVVQKLASIETFENFTGFGLYDRSVIEALKRYDDPYPYFRGLIAEIGLSPSLVPYDQPRRTRGSTKANLYALYDMAALAITNLSKVPLRFVTILGFCSSMLSFLVGLVYLAYKLAFWSQFSVGVAPLVIGLFFLGSVQLLALGIIGEYVGAIQTHVRKRPYVIEAERINFENPPGAPSSVIPPQ